jgi:DNA-3-methyladenine glycosylase I
VSYCRVAPGHPFHGPYHDREYGFPLRGDAALFERLVLEFNQAGLSWLTILKKRPAFVAAYEGFDLDRVAGYGARERARLLADPGIVRNRLKIDAAIENARRLVAIRDRWGSFAAWLDAHHPRSRDGWVHLFRKTFRFTGGEITGEFLLSTGYLRGAHARSCPVWARIARRTPPWMRARATDARRRVPSRASSRARTDAARGEPAGARSRQAGAAAATTPGRRRRRRRPPGSTRR